MSGKHHEGKDHGAFFVGTSYRYNLITDFALLICEKTVFFDSL